MLYILSKGNITYNFERIIIGAELILPTLSLSRHCEEEHSDDEAISYSVSINKLYMRLLRHSLPLGLAIMKPCDFGG
jgi:hypothetical protein